MDYDTVKLKRLPLSLRSSPSYSPSPASPAASHLYPHTFYFVTAICTVLLEIPNSLAACLTVALCSIMYSPRITGRSLSLGIVLNALTPKRFSNVYGGEAAFIPQSCGAACILYAFVI